jgi:hypothetical protein
MGENSVEGKDTYITVPLVAHHASLIPSLLMPARQRKSHLCIPRKGIARPQAQFHVAVSAIIYSHIFSCSRIGGPIIRIYKSLTDT